MATNTKAIKNRIKSVKNTKKITKAMEMVAAAKMRRSVEATLNTRLYAMFARQIMENLSQLEEKQSPLLSCRPVGKILLILVSSNRGLCGSFNSNLFKKTAQLFLDKKNISRHRNVKGEDIFPQEDIQVDVIGVGKRGAVFAKKHGYVLSAAFDKLSEKMQYEDMLPISSLAIQGFVNEEYDKVMVAFTEYQSSIVQIPKVRQLLPLSAIELEKMLQRFDIEETEKVIEEKELPELGRYSFEPSIETIVEYVLPRLVEIQLYQALLESAASEHSARMVAMKNASDSASDMIDALTMQYNKGRQAAITQEISEIVGGASALE